MSSSSASLAMKVIGEGQDTKSEDLAYVKYEVSDNDVLIAELAAFRPQLEALMEKTKVKTAFERFVEIGAPSIRTKGEMDNWLTRIVASPGWSRAGAPMRRGYKIFVMGAALVVSAGSTFEEKLKSLRNDETKSANFRKMVEASSTVDFTTALAMVYMSSGDAIDVKVRLRIDADGMVAMGRSITGGMYEFPINRRVKLVAKVDAASLPSSSSAMPPAGP